MRYRKQPLIPDLKHFRAKWVPVRVKKMRRNKRLEPGSDSIRTGKALAQLEIFTLVRFTISSIRADSLALVAPNSSGLSAMTVKPRPSRRAETVGSRNAATMDVLSLSMTSLGVAAGATKPYQLPARRSGNPACAEVGTSGSCLLGSVAVTTIGRSAPLRTCSTTFERLSHIMDT